jgi:hypothetical protein
MSAAGRTLAWLAAHMVVEHARDRVSTGAAS